MHLKGPDSSPWLEGYGPPAPHLGTRGPGLAKQLHKVPSLTTDFPGE